VTIKDSYPLPRIDDCLDALAGCKWFSTPDLCSGYWQVAMAEADKPAEGGSLSPPQPDPKHPPPSQQFPSESSESKKAFIVTGSKSDLRASQVADDDLGKIIAWKESCPSRPAWKDVSTENKTIKTYWSQWDCLSLRNGVLCQRWESEAGDKVHWQLVMPSSLRNDVLQELHTEETAGHLDVNKTLGRVKESSIGPGAQKM